MFNEASYQGAIRLMNIRYPEAQKFDTHIIAVHHLSGSCIDPYSGLDRSTAQYKKGLPRLGPYTAQMSRVINGFAKLIADRLVDVIVESLLVS